MDEVNRTLYIPLYGKSKVSAEGIILRDPTAEKIWAAEGFPIRGKSKSRWLAYNMAMRARVFDDWTDDMLEKYPDALVLHIGCGLDARCHRVRRPYRLWIDCDFPEVIAARQKYFDQTETYRMKALDASDPEQFCALPDAASAIVVLEGLCMYLTPEELRAMFRALAEKYGTLCILADVYTKFGARASKYKNPVNDVGVTKLYWIDDMEGLLSGLPLALLSERTFTPAHLVDELRSGERRFFKLMFTGKKIRKIYRLFEIGTPSPAARDTEGAAV